MSQLRCVSLVGLLLALGAGASLSAGKDDEDETAPDQPVLLETSPFHAPVRLKATDGVIDSGASWGHSSPWLVDVDGDGVQDLVVGDFSGRFRFYRNQGTNRQPRYARAVNLQAGGVDARVPIY